MEKYRIFAMSMYASEKDLLKAKAEYYEGLHKVEDEEHGRLCAELETLKELAGELLTAADKCGQKPYYIVQPFWNIVRKHNNIIEKYNLLSNT